jgi:hypothetical protein
VFRVDGGGAQVTPGVGIGGTVPPDPRELGVNVEVQVPQYLDVTKVELYMHQPQDDLACPVESGSPKANLTRVACNGIANANWPASGITASQVVSLTAGDLETVRSEGALAYRRYRKAVGFRLPAPPTDNYLVAFVYGSATMFPLNYSSAPYGAQATATAPFALTNPVFIDADGNGYDKPPFNPAAPRSRALPPARPVLTVPATEAEVARRWGEQLLAH